MHVTSVTVIVTQSDDLIEHYKNYKKDLVIALG